MTSPREQVRTLLETIRSQLGPVPTLSSVDANAARLADQLLAASAGGSGGLDVRELLDAAGDILVSTPEGEALREELAAGAAAKSTFSWMLAIKVLGACLQNMRDLLCEGHNIRSITSELKLTPEALNALVGNEIMSKLKLTSPAIRILGIIFLMVFDEAAYKTFCQMTDGQIIERVTHSATFG